MIESETVYGETMPIRVYSIEYSCGCVHRDIRCASNVPIEPYIVRPWECPDCYDGPTGNVWD